jgi:hypothetical protein
MITARRFESQDSKPLRLISAPRPWISTLFVVRASRAVVKAALHLEFVSSIRSTVA